MRESALVSLARIWPACWARAHTALPKVPTAAAQVQTCYALLPCFQRRPAGQPAMQSPMLACL